MSLKMMKIAFYVTLKALFVLKYLNFCPDFFGNVEKRLDKKVNSIIQIQLIAIAFNSIIFPLFKWFFHETRIQVVESFVYFNTEKLESMCIHIAFT